jgi:hypothetical protein
MSIRWTAAEVVMLQELAGDYPWPEVKTRFNTWARKHGFVERSEVALCHRCELEGFSRVCTGSCISTGTIRELTGAGWLTIQRWIKSGVLNVKRSGRKLYVSRESLKRLALRRPEHFAGLSVSALTQLLDDERLAERLAAMPRAWVHGKRKQVRCVETGEVFPSAAAAGRRFNLSRSAVSLVVLGKRPGAGGHHFEAA